GVLSNLLAPRFADWWSTRSQDKLIKRIQTLETRLAEARAKEQFTEAEDRIYEMLYSILTTVLLFADVVYVGMLLTAVVVYRAPKNALPVLLWPKDALPR